MAYIHLYKGAVTAGGTDGTQVSEGDNSNPLSIGTLNVTVGEESEPVKVALRCENGYETRNTTTISLTGNTADKWALALDNNGVPGTFGDYGASISTTDTIGATNWIFWVKAQAEVNESPTDDASVKINVAASVVSTSYTG
ncbi:MAG: hypothetical protein ACI3ZR_00070 [bacterium]